MATIPRSVRNNNPGNLRRGQPWRGLLSRRKMTPAQKEETEFAVFVSPAYGFRALAKLLRNYRTIYGLSSVREIVGRFAPASENDTKAYIRAVAKHMGLRDADSELNLDSRSTLFLLCKGIAIHEAGGWNGYWTDRQLEDGLDLAGF